jgi:ribosomal protein S12 methylthiotransferase
MTANSTERPVRVGMISLGCAKNLVDAEIMLGTLLQAGLEITNDAGQADVVIVNTCSFIDSAQEESVDTILESAELRNAKNRGQTLIVSGCLPQRFRDELPALLPEVDAFIGIDQVSHISEVVKKAMARRAEKSGSGVRSSKSKVVGRLAELEGPRVGAESRTARTAPQLPSPAPSTQPIFDVTLRPQYIPDYATPRFRLTPGISPT